MKKLPKTEYENRISNLREKMAEDGTDVFIVYGDEYRRENLRYVSNYWPIFERGMLVVGAEKDPVLLVSPECEHLAEEMSAWDDIRLVREVGMSYVPEEVDFSNIEFTTMENVIGWITGKKSKLKVKLSGIDAMSVVLYERIKEVLGDADLKNGDDVLYSLRLTKSPVEVEMLKRAWEICDKGYKAVLDADIVGLTDKHGCRPPERKNHKGKRHDHVFFGGTV